MNIKRKSIAMLGIIGLLAAAAVGDANAMDPESKNPPHHKLRSLATGGSLLLATGNPQPTAASTPDSAPPVLVAAEPLFEFGRVLEGTEVVHDFLIENRGAGDLHIDQVRTG